MFSSGSTRDENHCIVCAEKEFAEVVDYYNDQRSGFGYEFAAEIQRTFERIRQHPEAWPVLSSRARRCLTDRFPFGILYQLRGDCILVGGIMHLKRDPKRWQARAGDINDKDWL